MELLVIFFRTIIVYFLIIFIMRIMGKREVGQLSIVDLTVSFMIAALSSMAVELDKNLLHFVLPVLVLVLLQIATSYLSLKSVFFRNLLDGKPEILIKNGKIQEKVMKKYRYSLDDLRMQLREKDIYDLKDVEMAILETSGHLSVIPKSKVFSKAKKYTLPVPVIVEGKIIDEGLQKLNKSYFWLRKELKKRGIKDFKEIFFASVNAYGEFYIDKFDKS